MNINFNNRNKQTDELLKLAAELQEFDPDEELAAMIDEQEQSEELSLDSLDMVNAASFAPRNDFDRFMKKYREGKK